MATNLHDLLFGEQEPKTEDKDEKLAKAFESALNRMDPEFKEQEYPENPNNKEPELI